MPKVDTHTKKHVKSKNVKYDLLIANKDDGEFYGKVLSTLGGNRIKVLNNKKEEIQVSIRGNFSFGAKKENVNFPNSDRHEYWILVQPGISKNQYFLKHIYNDNDINSLKNRGELSNNVIENNIINTITTEINLNEDNANWLDNI
jgi:hypothetical protein